MSIDVHRENGPEWLVNHPVRDTVQFTYRVTVTLPHGPTIVAGLRVLCNQFTSRAEAEDLATIPAQARLIAITKAVEDAKEAYRQLVS